MGSIISLFSLWKWQSKAHVRKINWSNFLCHHYNMWIRPMNVYWTPYSVSYCYYQKYDMYVELRGLFSKLCTVLSFLYPKCLRKEVSTKILCAFYAWQKLSYLHSLTCHLEGLIVWNKKNNSKHVKNGSTCNPPSCGEDMMLSRWIWRGRCVWYILDQGMH